MTTHSCSMQAELHADNFQVAWDLAVALSQHTVCLAVVCLREMDSLRWADHPSCGAAAEKGRPRKIQVLRKQFRLPREHLRRKHTFLEQTYLCTQRAPVSSCMRLVRHKFSSLKSTFLPASRADPNTVGGLLTSVQLYTIQFICWFFGAVSSSCRMSTQHSHLHVSSAHPACFYTLAMFTSCSVCTSESSTPFSLICNLKRMWCWSVSMWEVWSCFSVWRLCIPRSATLNHDFLDPHASPVLMLATAILLITIHAQRQLKGQKKTEPFWHPTGMWQSILSCWNFLLPDRSWLMVR